VLQAQAYILVYRRADPGREPEEMDPKEIVLQKGTKSPAQGHLNHRPPKIRKRESNSHENLPQEPQGRISPRLPIEETRTRTEPPAPRLEAITETPLEPEEQQAPLTETLPILHNLLRSYLKLSRGSVEDLTGLQSELSGTPITSQITCKWIGTEPLDPNAPLEEIRIEDLINSLIEDPEDTPAMLIPR